MVNKTLFVFLILLGLFSGCKSRYGYLSKVRVGSTHKQQLGKDKIDKLNSEEAIEIDEEDNSTIASNDSNIILLNNSLFKNYKEIKSKQAPKHKKQEIDKKKLLKKFSKGAETNINYYAKWALIMGVISLLAFPLIIPAFLGPVDILLGIIALKQIKKSGEKGKGRAIYAILIGSFFTILLIVLFIVNTFGMYPLLPIPVMFLIAIGVLIFNLIWYILIINGNKNPANKEQVENRNAINKRTKKLLIIAFFYAFLTALFSVLIIGLAFGPSTWILSQRALKRMPYDGRNLRFITQLVMILGILATLLLVVLGVLFFFGVFLDPLIAGLIALALILAIILTPIAFAIRGNYPKLILKAIKLGLI